MSYKRITSCCDPDYASHFGHLPAQTVECDGCGQGIAPEHLEAATQVKGLAICELCRTEGE